MEVRREVPERLDGWRRGGERREGKKKKKREKEERRKEGGKGEEGRGTSLEVGVIEAWCGTGDSLTAVVCARLQWWWFKST